MDIFSLKYNHPWIKLFILLHTQLLTHTSIVPIYLSPNGILAGAVVVDWTCCCSTQDAHTFHLCKHLVHSAGTLPMAFWEEIYHHQVKPLDQHSHLSNWLMQSGTMSDSDDQDHEGARQALTDFGSQIPKHV